MTASENQILMRIATALEAIAKAVTPDPGGDITLFEIVVEISRSLDEINNGGINTFEQNGTNRAEV